MCALCAPLPSLGVSRGSGHVLPLGRGAPCLPVLGTLCLEPCLVFCSCQTLWVTLLPWCLSALVGPGQDGGGSGPFLLGWIVHMLIVQTQCHIFIIVIKLYCTKSAWSVSLGKSRVGWGLRSGCGSEEGEVGGLELGRVEGLRGKNRDPQTATIALGHPMGWNSH